MKSSATLPPLIIDPDLDFHQRILSDPQAKVLPPILTADPKQAEQALVEPRSLSAVFISPDLSNPLAIPTVKLTLKHRPSTPIFYLADQTGIPLPEKDLEAMMIRKVLRKPLTYGQILKAIADANSSFNAEAALEKAKTHQDALGSTTDAEDTNFSPIIAANFVAGTNSYFDVYVRLSANKFLKILQAGDAFSQDRLDSYRKKGATLFYIRREAQEHYLQFCDQLTSSLLKNAKVPVDLKVNMALNHGQETLSFLRNNGLQEEAVGYAEKFVGNVQQLITRIEPLNHGVFKKFLEDAAHAEHAVAITIIANLLAKPLGFHAEKSVSLIGLSSFFHDIGLEGLDPKFREEKESLLNDDEKELFRQHPIRGAQLMSQIPAIDSFVVQAISQHHERRTRNGFPNRIGAGLLSRVAEIIGISEEFIDLIKRSRTEGLNPFEEMQARYFNEFSTPITDAFRGVFMSGSSAGKKSGP